MSDRVTMPCTVPFERTRTAGFDFDSSFATAVHRLRASSTIGNGASITWPTVASSSFVSSRLFGRQRPVAHRADAVRAVHHRQLRHVVQRHETQRLAHGLAPVSRSRCPACRRVRPWLSAARIERRAIGVEHLVLAHPLVAVELRQIALAGVRQRRDDERVRIVDLPRDVQRDVDDQSARAADEQPSSRVRRRAIANDSLSLTVMKSSITLMSSVPGILSCPMPSTLYGTPFRLGPSPSCATSRRGSSRQDRRR